ncbi:hypothetical protein L3Q82_025807 [Scortum barcoo]|uniref:Uncharacterized protein n=1 Tax=Scortum barcoo TaxID=214431 RepID=A0ACB8WL81_9TELE|nr:hypothetical protein L3Q82_025807 [Scortum barcoo]
MNEFGLWYCALVLQMWLWILTGLCIITKVHGFASGNFPQSCESMSPDHPQGGLITPPQNTVPPFEVLYQHGKKGDPITVSLQSKQSTKFKGFMLEARKKGVADPSPPVGKFIILDESIRLLTCNGLTASAVSQRNNQPKSLFRVNWTAEGAELDIFFRYLYTCD